MMRKSLLALCLAGAFLAPFVLAEDSSSSGVTQTTMSSTSTTDNSMMSSSTGNGGGVITDNGSSMSMSSSGNGNGNGMSSSSTGTSGGSGELPATAPTVDGSQTFCQKYTKALNSGVDNAENEQALIAAVVTRAVLGNQTATTPMVPGIVGANSPIKGYFDGTIKFKDNQPNFVQDFQQHGANNTAYPFALLADHLVKFFGEGLGCTAAGFPAYDGNRNMTAVHQGMAIDWNQMQYFDQQVALSMQSFGVDPTDITNVGVPYLYQFNRYPSLHDNTVFPTGSYGAGQKTGYPITEREICKDSSCPIAPPAYSFCEKYAQALYGYVNSTSEVNLVTAVVSRAVVGGSGNGQTVQGIVGAGSPLIPFFNSSIQYRTGAPNYIQSYSDHGLDAQYDFGKLASHLVQFFGPALGCRDPQYPQNQGSTDMRSVHANMPITKAYFDYFNQQIADSALSFGADPTDVALVGQALQGFLRGDNINSVCNQADCPCQAGLTKDASGNCVGTPTNPPKGNGNGAALVSPSVAGMGVALVSAVVALLL